MQADSVTSELHTLKVDIVSDVICPWCWLGAKYFHEAARLSGKNIELTWRPYMLDPNVPKEGVPYKDYMRAKFGEAGPGSRWTAMREHLEASGPEAGILFNFSGIKMRPNTLNAHRLIRWAQGQGVADDMANALFKAAFTDNLDIGDIDVLSKLAGEVGLDKALIKDLLASDKDKGAVETERQHFQNLGINAVPTFIYNGQFVVQGAQPIDTHLSAIQQASKPAK